MKQILVTGASGFVGRHLIPHLLGEGHRVFALSRSAPVAGAHHIPVADYTPVSIAAALRGREFDAFIHLAGAGSVPTDRNILTLTRINAILPGIIVEAAAKFGARAVVMAGSYAEYASPAQDELLTEKHPLEESEPYGTSKAAGAEFALAQGKFYNIPVAVGRLFNLYGPQDTLRHRLFPSLVDRLKTGQEVSLSEGRQARDFVYIKDACSAVSQMMHALMEGTLPSAAYNIASGCPCSVADFAKKTAQALNVDVSLLKFGALPPRAVPDAPFMVGDPSLLHSVTGWKCAHSLHEGLHDSVRGGE